MKKLTGDNWSYEDALSVFIQLREQEQGSLWAQADLARALTAKYGRKTATMLAKDVGLSAAYVRQLIAAANAFPDPSLRAQDLSFSHHRAAAMTENPEGWLERATENAWSHSEMLRAIRDSKDKIDEAEQARRAGERLEQAVRKFNEHWAEKAGRKAVLSWEDAVNRFPLTPGEDAALILAYASPGDDPAKESAMIADAIQIAEEVFSDG